MRPSPLNALTIKSATSQKRVEHNKLTNPKVGGSPVTYLHIIHKLGHELQQNDQRTPLVTPTRIHIFVRVSDDHGLHRQPRRERPCFKRDDRFPIRSSPFWKQHDMRPLVVHRPPFNIPRRMVPGLRIHSVHGNNLQTKTKKQNKINTNPKP